MQKLFWYENVSFQPKTMIFWITKAEFILHGMQVWNLSLQYFYTSIFYYLEIAWFLPNDICLCNSKLIKLFYYGSRHLIFELEFKVCRFKILAYFEPNWNFMAKWMVEIIGRKWVDYYLYYHLCWNCRKNSRYPIEKMLGITHYLKLKKTCYIYTHVKTKSPLHLSEQHHL